MDAPNAGERTVLVTGGARGIGRAIAERLAESGWHVIATYLTGLDEAKELARTHDVQIRQIDLTDRAKTVDFSQQICAEFPLTVLVNNAGFLEKEPFEEMTFEAWDKTMAVNVTAPLILAQAMGPRIPAGGSMFAVIAPFSTQHSCVGRRKRRRSQQCQTS